MPSRSPNKKPMNNFPKVTLLTRHYRSRGGLEKWANLLAQGFAKRGCPVDILTADAAPTTPLHPLMNIHTLPLTRWGKMKAFDRQCQKWAKSPIIFGIDRTTHQTHLRAGNGVHKTYLEQRKTFENYSPLKEALNPLNKTILHLEKKAFESPLLKTLFTNSHMVKNEILRHYNVSPEKIEVIHNGAHLKEKDFNEWTLKKQKVAEELFLDPAKYHFLFVGSGYQRKGLSFLLKALSLLPNRDFHLSVVGKEREIERFMTCANQLGLSKHVSFFGPRADVTPFYQLADSLVIPSIYDPFANVTVEALSMGLFVVSSKYNGGYEVLQEESGTVIEALQDPDSLKEALMTAMMHPKTWVRSQTIRESVKHLDLSNQVSSIIDLTLERL
ncbi:glycosyltransferase family 4 protein [Candidatus Neptunochlamydia vexilliferae]|nr:glycosyltransferase family 4 protein [Candidatus Neptunochlamydia vexilliferae]